MGKMTEDAGDRGLALSAAAGDRDAFARLVAAHYARVHRLGWRLLGSPADAEDLAQDVFTGLAGKIRLYRGEAAFTTWLTRVVINAARDRQRAEGRRETLLRAYAEADALRRAGEAEAADRAGWLAEAMTVLSSDLRETAVLVLDLGFTHHEAGEALGVKEATVSWRMAEIRRRLKALAEAGEDVTQ